MKMEF